MSADFYILDPDSLRRDHLTWWRPSSHGYTSRLDEAGLYTESFARSSGIAVHRDHAHEAAVTVVDRSRLRKTGALDEHDLRRNVEEAWRGVYYDSEDAAEALAWTEEITERVMCWHSMDVLALAEWKRVASTVQDDEPGRPDVRWPSAEVCFDESLEAVIARAEIGGLMFSSSGRDRQAARLALVALVQIAGSKERGEPIT